MNREKLIEKIVRVFYTASPEKTEYHNYKTVDVACFGGYKLELVKFDTITASTQPMCVLNLSIGEFKTTILDLSEEEYYKIKEAKNQRLEQYLEQTKQDFINFLLITEV